MASLWRTAPRDIRLLLVVMMLINLGFFALIPYLSLYLTGSFLWSLALTGILLGVRQFSQQGFTFLGGVCADRWGCKPTLMLGLLVRSSGFTAFAFCTETWHFFLSAVLAGLGGALFEPANQAAFAKLSPEDQRKSLFALKNMLSNVSIVASSIVGSALVSFNFQLLSIVSGSIYAVLALVIYAGLPPIRIEIHTHSIRSDLATVLKDGQFLLFTLVLIGYYYLFMQLYLSIPQLVLEVTGDQTDIAYVYATVSAAVVLFQLKVTKLLARFPNRFSLIGFGALSMGVGLFLMGFAGNLAVLCACSVLFALGTMIAAPIMMDVIPSFAPPRLLASYYGFNGYSMAFGGALGTSLGGWIFDIGKESGFPLLPWLTCLLISLLVLAGLGSLRDRRPQQAASADSGAAGTR